MQLVKERIFSDKYNILVIICVLISAVLFVRLFQKQVIQSSEYKALAKKQYLQTTEVDAQRGKIYANDKYEAEPYAVATNIHLYSISVIPKNVKNPTLTAQKIAAILGLNEKELFDKINNKKPYLPPVAKKVEKTKAKQIIDMELPGVMALSEQYRYYPESGFLSTVLGFVDTELNGRYGIEAFYNDELSGSSGKEVSSRVSSSSNQYITTSVQNGADVYLTIDRTVQYICEKYLAERITETKARSGEVIIAESATGKIIAMANSNSFNPNEYNKVTDINIFNNPSTSSTYEPGSTFKPVTMAAAIDQGLVTADTTGVFGASVQVKDRTIKTSTGKAYGKETMTQVLENSDNVAMVWVAQQLQREKFMEYVQKFGFGQRTGIDLEGEANPKLRETKKVTDVSLATMSFGQGISVTPIQLLSAYIALANNGKLMQPYLVDKIVDANGKVEQKQPKEVGQVIKSETAKTITQMLMSVVTNGHGKKAAVDGYDVAGKTGTAQIPDLVNGGYLANQNIGSFAGYFPANNPKYVMLVKIDVPTTVTWAEESAAPLFGKIAKWLLEYYQVPKTK